MVTVRPGATGEQSWPLRSLPVRPKLRPGDALPSINRIAQEWGCAKTTAAKALNVLKAEGLANGMHGWGTIVTPEDERPASR